MLEEDRLEPVVAVLAQKFNINKWRYVKRNTSGTVNYAGCVVPLLLIDEINGEEYEIAVKFPPDWPDSEAVDTIFGNEFKVYSKLLPLFRSLKMNTKMENLFPECYYTANEPDFRVIVLQDMTSKNFERNRNGINLNYEHTLVSLETISKFHAFSFVVMEKNTDRLANDLQIFSRGYPRTLRSTLKKGIEFTLPMFKNKYYSDYLQKIWAEFDKNMEESVSKAKGNVFGHGDFWKENILFKYSNGTPVEACLLDFQQTRRMNPLQDILFFIMTSTEETDRKVHLNNFLKYYYQSLQKILASNGFDGIKVYSEEDFYHDLGLVLPVCLVITLFSYALWLGVLDVEYLLLHKSKPNVENEAVNRLLETVDGLLSDFIRFGYIPELA